MTWGQPSRGKQAGATRTTQNRRRQAATDAGPTFSERRHRYPSPRALAFHRLNHCAPLGALISAVLNVLWVPRCQYILNCCYLPTGDVGDGMEAAGTPDLHPSPCPHCWGRGGILPPPDLALPPRRLPSFHTENNVPSSAFTRMDCPTTTFGGPTSPARSPPARRRSLLRDRWWRTLDWGRGRHPPRRGGAHLQVHGAVGVSVRALGRKEDIPVCGHSSRTRLGAVLPSMYSVGYHPHHGLLMLHRTGLRPCHHHGGPVIRVTTYSSLYDNEHCDIARLFG